MKELVNKIYSLNKRMVDNIIQYTQIIVCDDLDSIEYEIYKDIVTEWNNYIYEYIKVNKELLIPLQFLCFSLQQETVGFETVHFMMNVFNKNHQYIANLMFLKEGVIKILEDVKEKKLW